MANAQRDQGLQAKLDSYTQAKANSPEQSAAIKALQAAVNALQPG